MHDEDVQLKDVGKLWGAITEIRTALIGIDGRNGIRGELLSLKEDMKEQIASIIQVNVEQDKAIETLHTSLKEYIDVTRPATCIGKQALDEYKLTVKDKNLLSTEDKKSQRAMWAAIIAALFAGISPVLTAMLK